MSGRALRAIGRVDFRSVTGTIADLVLVTDPGRTPPSRPSRTPPPSDRQNPLLPAQTIRTASQTRSAALSLEGSARRRRWRRGRRNARNNWMPCSSSSRRSHDRCPTRRCRPKSLSQRCQRTRHPVTAYHSPSHPLRDADIALSYVRSRRPPARHRARTVGGCGW